MTIDPRNKDLGLPSKIPFLLFPRQREWIEWVIDCWKKREDGYTVKSRDMGVSWLTVALSCTLCLFNDEIIIGFGSRKAEYVDLKGAPKAFFPRARDFMMELPDIFRGGFELKDSPHMRLTIPETGSVITGESGDGIGRGDRAAIYFVDESAFLERPLLTEASLSQTTNCRIDVSTPNGMDNPFAEKVHSGEHNTFPFHWRDDPRKDEDWHAKQVKRLDPVTLAQEVEMDFNASKDGILIPAAWVECAVDAHKKLGVDHFGEKMAGFDVADQGKDQNALAFRDGILLEDVKSWHGKTVEDIFGSTSKAFDECDERGYKQFRFDSDGIGAGVRGDSRVLNEGRKSKIKVFPYHGGGELKDPDKKIFEERLNKEFFSNFKAQSWWDLRDRFKMTYDAIRHGKEFEEDKIISISSDIKCFAQLLSELCQVTYQKDGKGRILIDKAPDGSKSPNMADAVVIAFSPSKEKLDTISALLNAHEQDPEFFDLDGGDIPESMRGDSDLDLDIF